MGLSISTSDDDKGSATADVPDGNREGAYRRKLKGVQHDFCVMVIGAQGLTPLPPWHIGTPKLLY